MHHRSIATRDGRDRGSTPRIRTARVALLTTLAALVLPGLATAQQQPKPRKPDKKTLEAWQKLMREREPEKHVFPNHGKWFDVGVSTQPSRLQTGAKATLFIMARLQHGAILLRDATSARLSFSTGKAPIGILRPAPYEMSPPTVPEKGPFQGIQIYDDYVDIRIPIGVPADAPVGKYTIRGKVTLTLYRESRDKPMGKFEQSFDAELKIGKPRTGTSQPSTRPASPGPDDLSAPSPKPAAKSPEANASAKPTPSEPGSAALEPTPKATIDPEGAPRPAPSAPTTTLLVAIPGGALVLALLAILIWRRARAT